MGRTATGKPDHSDMEKDERLFLIKNVFQHSSFFCLDMTLERASKTVNSEPHHEDGVRRRCSLL